MRPETRARALGLVDQGKLIEAIKLVREATGAGLKEAKEYVDDLHVEVLEQRVPETSRDAAVQLVVVGKWKAAVKQLRQETGLNRWDAQKYVNALREGWQGPGGGGRLSDRVRAFKAAGDWESAIAVVRAETEMSRVEAERFVAALE
ncbi:ribosomal protein L7/L12 [Spirillospora sp. CA-255316]